MGIRVYKDWSRLQQSESARITEKEKFDASLAITQAVVGGVGTVATIAGGIILWLNLKETSKNTKLTESRLLTERFSKAVEQLGSEKIELRLGGIYSLERLAKDSPGDHWTIMEVLASFARRKSFNLEQKTNSRESSYDSEIQAALTVIGRRETASDLENQSLDFTESNLSGFIFSGLNFSTANFERANLSEANFSGAILTSTKFNDARLISANFTKVDLAKAEFISANLEGAKLNEAKLNEANLEGAFLYNADLTDVSLEKAILRGTHLRGGIFINAKLADAKFENAIFWDFENWYQRHWSAVERSEDELIQCWIDEEREASLSNIILDLYDDYDEYQKPESKPDFRGSNLTAAQAKSAKEWEEATYDEALRQELGLPNEDDESENF